MVVATANAPNSLGAIRRAATMPIRNWAMRMSIAPVALQRRPRPTPEKSAVESGSAVDIGEHHRVMGHIGPG